jgi:hypothetical protein
MITTVLFLTLSSSLPWTEVKANGFVFEMPSQPELKNGPVTWPTTGKMIQTEWTSKLKTGDLQNDTVGCYESTVASPRMIGLLHEKVCKPEANGQLRWDRTDASTQGKECLLLGTAPDGKRRTLVKILPVGNNVCVLSSSTRFDAVTDEPSPTMRRFVDSLKATGKPTVLSVTPWVVMEGKGFRFEMPEKAEAKITDVTDPKLGKVKATKYVAILGEEELSVTCMEVSSTKAAKALLAACETPGPKVSRTKLPNGATECAIVGPPTVLVRLFPLGKQTCLVSATRTVGESTQDARRFVESFAKAK